MGQMMAAAANSQSFCACPPSCFSRWPSRCRTCRKGSSPRPVQQEEEREQRSRSRYRDHVLLGRYYQLGNEHVTRTHRRSQVHGGLKVACVCAS